MRYHDTHTQLTRATCMKHYPSEKSWRNCCVISKPPVVHQHHHSVNTLMTMMIVTVIHSSIAYAPHINTIHMHVACSRHRTMTTTVSNTTSSMCRIVCSSPTMMISKNRSCSCAMTSN